MISGWNRFIYRNNVSNRMNMNINTGGYRSDKTYSLPPLRPPARREQSCPFVAEKGSPAYFPLPEMRQAGAGDRADGPVHQVLFSPLRAPVLEAFQEGQLRRHPESLPMPQLRNLRRDHGAEGQADDFLQPGLPGTMVFLTPNKERNDS